MILFSLQHNPATMRIYQGGFSDPLQLCPELSTRRDDGRP